MKNIKYLMLFQSVLFLSSFAIAQTVDLKFNPENGSKYSVTQEAIGSFKQMIGDQAIEMNTKYSSNLSYIFKDIAGNKELNTTVNHFFLSKIINAMGQDKEVTLDSDKTDSSSASQVARALKGSMYTAILDAKGSVLKIDGVAALLEKAGKFGDPTIQQQLNTNFSETALKGTIEKMFKIYPGKSVKKGDTWNTTIETKEPFSLTSANTYTLEKIENGKSFINVLSKVSTGGKQTMNNNNMGGSITADGDIKGSIVLDNKTGILETSNSVLTLKGTLEVESNELPMEMTITSKTEIKKAQ